jgi:hypothetical protein
MEENKMNRIIQGYLFSFLVIGSGQAKEQMVTFHVSGEDPTGSQTVVTIGNSALYRFNCNGCDTRPAVVTDAAQKSWRAWIPVAEQNSILFTVYRSEEVDQLVSKLDANIAKLSDMNDALTTRIDELSKRIQQLESPPTKP